MLLLEVSRTGLEQEPLALNENEHFLVEQDISGGCADRHVSPVCFSLYTSVTVLFFPSSVQVNKKA